MKRLLRVIAAAGQGSRMKATKALLDLQGKTALERISELSLPGFAMTSVVVLGHDAEAVRAEAKRLGCETVFNSSWPEGQTGSIQAGLRNSVAAAHYAFLLHPVDLPLIHQSSYDALAGSLNEMAAESLVATSFEMRRGHPLVFGEALRQKILGLGADESIRSLIAREGMKVDHVVVQDRWVRKDLDHPADLEEARRYLAGRG